MWQTDRQNSQTEAFLMTAIMPARYIHLLLVLVVKSMRAIIVRRNKQNKLKN